MKKCIKCGEEKEDSEFHKRKASKDGLQRLCKKCDYMDRNKLHKLTQRNNLCSELSVELKLCTKCKVYKSSNLFSLSRRNLDGLHNWCKLCTKLYQRSRVKVRTYVDRNSDKVNNLIRKKSLAKPSIYICAFGGCNTTAIQYHHIKYDDINNRDNVSIITPVCRYHHNVVEIYKNDGIDLSNKFSTRIQIERSGRYKKSIVSYMGE